MDDINYIKFLKKAQRFDTERRTPTVRKISKDVQSMIGSKDPKNLNN